MHKLYMTPAILELVHVEEQKEEDLESWLEFEPEGIRTRLRPF